jgi:hypothetical protein
MKRALICLIAVAMSTFGCATRGAVPEKTQLQIREFQTRMYDTNDLKMVMKAMLNVLQDDGYVVKNAVIELGLLTAEKEIDVESKGEAFMASFFAGGNARWKKACVIECTANVSEFGEQCRVRVTFQQKTLDNKGGILKVTQIEDPKQYQEFFAKVDKGIFIQKEKL